MVAKTLALFFAAWVVLLVVYSCTQCTAQDSPFITTADVVYEVGDYNAVVVQDTVFFWASGSRDTLGLGSLEFEERFDAAGMQSFLEGYVTSKTRTLESVQRQIDDAESVIALLDSQ